MQVIICGHKTTTDLGFFDAKFFHGEPGKILIGFDYKISLIIAVDIKFDFLGTHKAKYLKH